MNARALGVLLLGGSLVAGASVGAAPAKRRPLMPEAKPADKPEKKGDKAAPKKATPPMAFNPGELDLMPGESYPIELFVPSPTGKEAQGELVFTPEKGLTVKPDSRWTGKVSRYGAKTYPSIFAARDIEEGTHPVNATFADKQAALKVRVVRPEMEIIPGQMKLTLKVKNPFRTRLLNGRVIASNPDRFLQDITTLEFKVTPEKTQEIVFPLPGAAPADGEKYEFTLTVETYQGFRETKTHALTFPPNTDEK